MGSLLRRATSGDSALLVVLVAAFAAAVALFLWPDLLPMALGRPRIA